MIEPNDQGNIPHLPSPFIGRNREVAQIENALSDPDVRVITLYGVGGIGKSSLARFVVERQFEKNQFPGGIIWIDCSINDSLPKMLSAISKATDPKGIFIGNTRDEVVSYLRANNTLLVLDNYEIVAQNDEVLSFIGRLPKKVKALLVSRKLIKLPRRQLSIPLESFTEEETVSLLRHYLRPHQ